MNLYLQWILENRIKHEVMGGHNGEACMPQVVNATRYTKKHTRLIVFKPGALHPITIRTMNAPTCFCFSGLCPGRPRPSAVRVVVVCAGFNPLRHMAVKQAIYCACIKHAGNCYPPDPENRDMSNQSVIGSGGYCFLCWSLKR